jgi:prepilin-type N-terminal cleavage/methylation domain-containing protein
MARTTSRLQRTSAESGFTLIELSVTMMLLLVVVGSLLGVFEAVQRTAGFTQARVESTDQMRLAIERLTKELRQATSITTTSSASSLDMQTFVNGVATHVVYAASGSTFSRTSGSTTTVVLTDLDSTSIFTYTPSVTAPQVVSITFAVRPKQRPDTVLNLTSEVRLRNMENGQ